MSHDLERQSRRWKLLAITGWGTALILGLVFLASWKVNAQRALAREQEARAVAEQARYQAEQERQRAEQAMHEALRQRDQAEKARRDAEEAAKKAKERSERQLYSEQIRLAQQAWEQNGKGDVRP